MRLARAARNQLEKGIRKTKRRYKGRGIDSKSGCGPGTLMAAGAIAAATAMSVGAGAAYRSAAFVDSRGDHILVVDTQTALDGLHLVQAAE